MDFSKPRQADLISLSILLGIRKNSSIVKIIKKSWMAMMVLAMIIKLLKNKTMFTPMLLSTSASGSLLRQLVGPLLAQDVKLSYLMIRMMTRMRTTMMMISTTTRSGVGMTKL